MKSKIKPVTIFCSILLCYKVFAFPVAAQDNDAIKVAGYSQAATQQPLTKVTLVPPLSQFYANRLSALIKKTSNFGTNSSVVPCSVEILDQVNYVSTGSLVDESGHLSADIFFGGAKKTNLTDEEAEELSRFVSSGGVLYVSGGGWLVPTPGMGPEYNLLFEKLGLRDRFEADYFDSGDYLQTTIPIESPITRGPFGEVGSLAVDSIRKFDTLDMNGITAKTEVGEFVIHEKKIGEGYLVVTGSFMYADTLLLFDNDNENYFLNLFALGCGEQDFGKYEKVVLDVPSFKQGLPEYDGLDPVWENVIYDHGDQQDLWCGQTMAECACALTSATMVIRHNGIDRLWYNADIDPDSVNGYFNQFSKFTDSHYESYGFSSGNVLWAAVSGLTADANVVHQTPKLDQPVREDFDIEKIKQHIDAGIPVIQQVSGSFGTHWVVIKGYEPSTNRLIINDPAYPDPVFGQYAYLDERYTAMPSRSMITYVKTFSDFRYLELTSSAPQHFLVTDQNGNKTGYDPETDAIVEQIPDSQYIFEASYGDATGRRPVPPEGSGTNVLTIKLPQDGNYELEVFGESTPKVISVHSSDRAGKKVFESKTPDQNLTYRITYNEQSAGTEVNITKIVEEIEAKIDVEPLIKTNIIIPVKWLPVPVAILASDSFDVNKIDRTSLTFGKTGEEESLLSCANKLIDVNRDRKKDLLCYFQGDKTMLDVSDTEAILKGKHEGNVVFVGKDKVKVLKPWFLF